MSLNPSRILACQELWEALDEERRNGYPGCTDGERAYLEMRDRQDEQWLSHLLFAVVIVGGFLGGILGLLWVLGMFVHA